MGWFTGRTRGTMAAAALIAGTLGGGVTTAANAASSPPPCTHPVLVLTAMPLELSPIVARATLDPSRTVHVDDRTFYVGRLAGNDVVLAMTGIGMVNAHDTATAAFEHFRCPFGGAVFSGVAGSYSFIGDVMVPERWTRNGGHSWVGTNAAMLATARTLEGPNQVTLTQNVPVGDAACLCPGVDAPLPVRLPHKPEVHVGGDGETSDTFSGHDVPCVWGGGDIAGCEPCFAHGSPLDDSANFAANAHDVVNREFLLGMLKPPAKTTKSFASQDEETASVAQVAQRYGVPFLGIRAVSDGQGDPLHLPGFPFQFFVYRQLAGNNAAAVTVAFLKTWAAAGHPV